MHRHYNLLTFYLWDERVFFPRRGFREAARKCFLLSLSLSFQLESRERSTPSSDPNFINRFPFYPFQPSVNRSREMLFSLLIKNQYRSKFYQFPRSLKIFSIPIFVSDPTIIQYFFFFLQLEPLQEKCNTPLIRISLIL